MAAVDVAISDEADVPRSIPAYINICTEYAFHLKRDDFTRETVDWLRRNGHLQDLERQSEMGMPYYDPERIAMVQLANIVAGQYDTYALIEVEEKKPFGTHCALMRHHGHTVETDEVWRVEDVVAAMALFKGLDERYDHGEAGETTLVEATQRTMKRSDYEAEWSTLDQLYNPASSQYNYVAINSEL